MVDDFVNDKHLRFEFDEYLQDENVRCFAVYGDSSVPLINSVNGDQWIPGFKGYLIKTHGSNHSTIAGLFENNMGESVIRYIFQELMYQVVSQNDDYEIVKNGV